MTSETTLNRLLNNHDFLAAALITGIFGIGVLIPGIISHKFVFIISGGAGTACALLFGALKIGQQVKIAKFKNQTVVTPYTPGEGNTALKSDRLRIVHLYATAVGEPELRGNVTTHTYGTPRHSGFYNSTTASSTRNEDL
jgi:hypothetical protein